MSIYDMPDFEYKCKRVYNIYMISEYDGLSVLHEL